MTEPDNLQQALEKARRALALLEKQAAGFGSLHIPSYLAIEIEDKRTEITGIETRLKLLNGIHIYLTRIAGEFERYKDTTNIVNPALKPGSSKEMKPKKGARSEETDFLNFLMKFDPKYSPHNPDTLKPNEQAQEEQLEAYLLKNTRLALLGDPGAGKSTALRGLFREYAQRWEKDSIKPIPLFAPLNRWQETETLLDFLQKEAAELADSLPTLLKEGRVLLLLDGLNELPGLKRNEKTQEINDPRSKTLAALGRDYPKVLCLLSCRVKEFVGGPTWCDLHVLPLRRKQVEAIAKAYFADETEKVGQLITGLYQTSEKDKKKREKLQTLAEKPFYLKRLLVYFGATGEIPSNPALLLAYSLDTVIDDEINKGLLKAEEKEEIKKRLSLLAFNMTEAKEISTSQKQASGWLFKLRNGFYGEKEPEADANQQKQSEINLKQGESCGLLVIQGNEVKFAHQLLQEVFCALFLQKQELNNEWLVRTTEYGRFEEIWPMWGWLDKSLVEKVTLTLMGENEYLRYRASSALGKIGDARAIEPLILALKDKNIDMSYPAADALGALGPLALEPLIKILKHENDYVRRFIAYALGQIGDPRAVESLILALKDEVKWVRADAAEALGKIGDARALPELEQLAQEEKGEVWVSQAATNAIEKIKQRQTKPPSP